ncbi:hypothetical protein I8752_17710 [Nostocaceae cyanobacterium CENA369]|uniref:Uncharacterized protein n=1 Tax=Dendronalium phyllosphericum CENA369 TaxID=1725256 RepID=A0A8J7LIE1_9NOST|nr:hypothetical protein [Dendronalium phyllosphericum]MBH8574824.1 hypothetical protein [Dendronalium phyllosphericum CENA369]
MSYQCDRTYPCYIWLSKLRIALLQIALLSGVVYTRLGEAVELQEMMQEFPCRIDIGKSKSVAVAYIWGAVAFFG